MTAKKTPQDRKPKAAKVETKIERPEDVKGFDLLKPIDEVPVWDQTPVLALVAEMTDGANTAGDLVLDNGEAVRLLGEMGRALVAVAKDQAEFIKFASGKSALQDVATLAMAWAASLGEDESSENS